MRRLAAIALLAALALALPGAAAAQDDRGVLQAFLEDNLSDAGREVRILGFEGALSARATIEEITVADADGVWLTIGGAVLDWNRRALLRGRLEIAELSARTIEVARAPVPAGGLPDPEARSPFALPELPVSILIGALKVETLTLGAPLLGEQVDLRLDGSADLEGGAGNAALSVTRLGQTEGRLGFEGSFSNATRRMALALDLTEAANGIAANLIGLPGRPSVGLRLRGDAPISNFTAELALSTDGATRLAGTVTLADLPDADDPEKVMRAFTADIGGDLRPLVEEQYRAFLGADLRLAAAGRRLADGRTAVDRLSLGSDAMRLDGAVELGADGWPARIAFDGRIAPAAGDEVLLSLPGEPTRIAGADLRLGYDAAEGDAWTLELSVDGLRRADLALQAARLTGRGSLSPGAARVAGRLDLALDGIAPADQALAAAIGPNLTGGLDFDWSPGAPLSLTAMDLTGADHALTGDATIEGADGQLDLAIAGRVRLAAADLGRFALLAGLPLAGGAEVAIEGSVAPVSGSFDLRIAGSGRDLGVGLQNLDPLLAGATRLDISAARDTSGTRIERLLVLGETSRIEASGTLASGQSDLAFALRIDDAAQVIDGAAGPATLAGTASQRGDDWRLDLTAGGPGDSRASFAGNAKRSGDAFGAVAGSATLEIGDLGAWAALARRPIGGSARLTAEASGDLRDLSFAVRLDGNGQDVQTGIAEADPLLAGASMLALAVRRDAAGNLAVDRLDLRTGGEAANRVTLAGTAERQGDGFGQVAGNATLDIADLAVFEALAGRPVGGALSLAAEASGDLGDGSFTARLDGGGQDLRTGIAEADLLLAGASTLGVTARRDAQGILVFDRLVLRTPRAIADLTGSHGPERSRVRYSFDLSDLGLFISGVNGPVAASGVAGSTGGPWDVTGTLGGPGGTTAAVEGTVARDGASVALAITGTGPLALANRFIAPNLAEGTAEFALRLDGAPGLAALSGTVSTGGARLTLPGLRLGLTGIAAEARIAGGAAEIGATGAVSTGGRMTLAGRMALTRPFAGGLAATLAGVGVSQPGLYETTVDGRIALDGPLAGGAALSGALALGPTEIRIPDSAGGAGGALPGLIHVREPAAVRQTRARAGLIETGGRSAAAAYTLDLLISAPARVFVRGRGLDAELGGSLRLLGSTAAVATEGRFDLIRGRLDILGKRLVLSEAFAQLQGDFDPYIRAVASTDTADARVQIVVEGLASSPAVNFASTPDMPEDEILARLLFGRDITQISPLQALRMADAVRTLAGGGGEGIVGRLRQNFGLDDLDIAAGEDGEAGLRLGKYISENVYTDVTVDTSGKSEINLNLTITPSITARGSASSDGNTGIGVFFERDY